MSEIVMEERISIRESARALKKYGSTSHNPKRQENFVKHYVQGTDTLQGLALRYGVTTEQIRRANRLWANDSLFLRKSLLIPVEGASPSDVVDLEGPSSPESSPNDHQPQPQPQPQPWPNTNNHINNNNNDVNNDPSYNDFLVKIDCSIASTKSQVMMSQDNSQFVDNDSLFVRRKSAMSRLRQQQQMNQSGSGNINGSEVPVVMTQGRKVRSSLQRLEREQDEMFEL